MSVALIGARVTTAKSPGSTFQVQLPGWANPGEVSRRVGDVYLVGIATLGSTGGIAPTHSAASGWDAADATVTNVVGIGTRAFRVSAYAREVEDCIFDTGPVFGVSSDSIHCVAVATLWRELDNAGAGTAAPVGTATASDSAGSTSVTVGDVSGSPTSDDLAFDVVAWLNAATLTPDTGWVEAASGSQASTGVETLNAAGLYLLAPPSTTGHTHTLSSAERWAVASIAYNGGGTVGDWCEAPAIGRWQVRRRFLR